jgi:DNA recombination protein RmuC
MGYALVLLIGIVAGAAAVAMLRRAQIRALTGDLERADTRADSLARELVRAEADLRHERELSAERLQAARAAQTGMADTFKALSADAVQAGVTQLSEMTRAQLNAAQEQARAELKVAQEQARAQLEQAQQQARGDLDRRREAVEQLVAPLKDQLGRVDAQLVKLDQERRESRGRLEAQIRTLSETGEKLRSETGALVTALRKPNARGQWGQMQLRKVVELAGMVNHCDFSEQSTVAVGDAALRPDLVVGLPGGKRVVVDAKAPLQGVLDAYEARDEEERTKHLTDHARLLRKHVKQLASKSYWDGLESAPDFVVLFLPGEHLYGAALESDPALHEDAMAQSVLIATPTTLLALLRAVAYGWQQERVAESAQAISELGRELYGRVSKLSGHFATLGQRLNSAVRAYNETVGSYESRVIPSARRLADAGAAAAGSELPELEHVTTSARSVQTAPVKSADVTAMRLPIDDAADEVTARRLRAAE